MRAIEFVVERKESHDGGGRAWEHYIARLIVVHGAEKAVGRRGWRDIIDNPGKMES